MQSKVDNFSTAVMPTTTTSITATIPFAAKIIFLENKECVQNY